MHYISKELKAGGLVILSGILYGFLGYFGTSLIYDHLSLYTMLFWRFFVASVWMFLWGFLRQERLFSSALTVYSFIKLFLFSAIFYSGGSLLFFMASHHTGTGLAMVIFFAYPLFVAIYSWLKGEWKINVLTILSLLSILIGLVLLKGNQSNTISFTGIVIGLIASLSYAVYVLKSKEIAKNLLTTHITTIVCLSCTVVFLTLALLTQSFAFPISLKSWLYVLGLGIIATALPIQLLFEGLKVISPLKASILSVLEPVVTLIVGFLLLEESLSSVQFLGVLVVLGGALLIQFARE